MREQGMGAALFGYTQLYDQVPGGQAEYLRVPHVVLQEVHRRTTLLTGDGDPLGVDTFATHHLPLAEAPDAYAMFQKKSDGAIKVLFRP